MAEVTYKGKTFEVDEDGFLLKFDEWCPEWLEYVKESEGITDLNEDHQKILDFLQDYYRKNGKCTISSPPAPVREPARWLVCPSPPAACDPILGKMTRRNAFW